MLGPHAAQGKGALVRSCLRMWVFVRPLLQQQQRKICKKQKNVLEKPQMKRLIRLRDKGAPQTN